MIKQENRKVKVQKRHRSIRNKISGTAEFPRLAVYRSTKHIYAQLIDDVNEQSKVKTQMEFELLSDKKASFKEYKYKRDKNFYDYFFDMYSNIKGLNTQTEFIEKIMAESNQIDYPAFIYIN